MRSRKVVFVASLLAAAIVLGGRAIRSNGASGDTIADVVIGQIDFIHNGINNPDARETQEPKLSSQYRVSAAGGGERHRWITLRPETLGA